MRGSRLFVRRGQLPVIQLIEQPRVDSWHLLHGEVNLVEPFPVAIEEEFGYPAGDGRGSVGLCQLRQLHPLTPKALLGAEVDVIGQGPEPADEVHVRHAEGSRVLMLLPHAQ